VTTLRFETSTTIDASPAAIYAELAEPRRQLGLQPLLVDVHEIERGETDTGAAYRVFEAVERFRFFGVVRWHNRIRVRVELVRPGEILAFEAKSRPGITLRSRFSLESSAAATVVREQLEIEVPALLAGFVGREAERVHEQLLANLKRRLEAPGRAP